MQLAKKIPPFILYGWGTRTGFQLLPSPIDGTEGNRVESVRIEERRLVVIAKDRHLRADNYLIQALARIGPIADNISQAVDFTNALRANIVENNAQRFHIGMDVAD
jgi:hypothetical protein